MGPERYLKVKINITSLRMNETGYFYFNLFFYALLSI